MKITEIKVSEIKAYAKNVKKHDDEQVKQIANSIKQFGFRQPVVVDKNNEIVIGHGRVEAAKVLDMDTVPCIKADDLTEEQIKALRIADNKLAEKAVWDNDALAEELKAIGESIDMTDFGFGDFELEILTGDFEPEVFDKEETQAYDEKEGDYLAKKRIIINYSDEEEDVVKKLLGIPLEEKVKVLYDIKELVDVNADIKGE